MARFYHGYPRLHMAWYALHNMLTLLSIYLSKKKNSVVSVDSVVCYYIIDYVLDSVDSVVGVEH